MLSPSNEQLLLSLVGTFAEEAMAEEREIIDNRRRRQCNNKVVDWREVMTYGQFVAFLWPALLLVQFEMARMVLGEDASGLNRCTVRITMGLFSLTILLYDRSLGNAGIAASTMAVLLPDMITVLAVLLIMLYQFPEALFAVIFGIAVMALFVTVSTLRLLLLTTTTCEDYDTSALGYEKVEDENLFSAESHPATTLQPSKLLYVECIPIDISLEREGTIR